MTKINKKRPGFGHIFKEVFVLKVVVVADRLFLTPEPPGSNKDIRISLIAHLECICRM